MDVKQVNIVSLKSSKALNYRCAKALGSISNDVGLDTGPIAASLIHAAVLGSNDCQDNAWESH